MNKYSDERKEVGTYGFKDQTTDLLKRLVSLDNYHKHIDAKQKLEKQGKKILPVLYVLTHSKSDVIRKEAVKIIKVVGDRTSIPVAIKLLEDNDGDIRWIAAESLIHIGRQSIRPLLQAIYNNPEAYYLREGAHHVMAALIRDRDAKELKELHRSLLNGELLASMPLRISNILNNPKIDLEKYPW